MTTPTDRRQPLAIRQVAHLPPVMAAPDALIEELWAQQAVGVLGGEPKCCKTFLALEMALAVAAGTPCLGRFRVKDPGPVLLFAAEDAPVNIRQRLHGLAQARGVDFDTVPIFLILTEQLRLDQQDDLERLTQALDTHRPRLLILDPFVRLHRRDENSAREISALLADLRALQRRFAMAIILVHHTRKSQGHASGQNLRGSGDLHAWGDTNLYLQRRHENLRLTVEHRTARAPQPMALTLTGQPPHLRIEEIPTPTPIADLQKHILDTLHHHNTPLNQEQLRQTLKIRNQSLTTALRQLLHENKITRTKKGWTAPIVPS
jgi:hypothetical protein